MVKLMTSLCLGRPTRPTSPTRFMDTCGLSSFHANEMQGSGTGSGARSGEGDGGGGGASGALGGGVVEGEGGGGCGGGGASGALGEGVVEGEGDGGGDGASRGDAETLQTCSSPHSSRWGSRSTEWISLWQHGHST